MHGPCARQPAAHQGQGTLRTSRLWCRRRRAHRRGHQRRAAWQAGGLRDCAGDGHPVRLRRVSGRFAPVYRLAAAPRAPARAAPAAHRGAHGRQALCADRLPLRLRLQSLHLQLSARSHQQTHHQQHADGGLRQVHRLHGVRQPLPGLGHLRLQCAEELVLPACGIRGGGGQGGLPGGQQRQARGRRRGGEGDEEREQDQCGEGESGEGRRPDDRH